jgi:predicted ATPase
MEEKILKVYYHPKLKSSLFRDGEVEEQVREWWLYVQRNGSQVLPTSQELVVQCVRTLIKEKVIPVEQVQINFVTELPDKGPVEKWVAIKLKPNGHLDSWPDGFCDTYCNFVDRLYDAVD